MNREQTMSIGFSSTKQYLRAIAEFSKNPTKKLFEVIKIEQEKRSGMSQTVKHQQVS